ncbi:hypothetical protein FRX31_004318 [Thalictrum thalictroides]|uniref:Uncharacterized protein n=1 Tax=Thalictrum thalictroides TaxID=46969 RepID=A0A7J6XCB5_THATH|nr:hypothetical protein FRX31_004318 [Thalictrum thalictroides]
MLLTSIHKEKLKEKSHTNGISATGNPMGDVWHPHQEFQVGKVLKNSSALTINAGGGDAGQSNPTTLSMPKALRYKN